VIEVNVESTLNRSLYPPDGVKSVFTIKREKNPGTEEFELVLLIDNHAPFGFHEHPKLPDKHDYTRTIHISSWQDAWFEFEKRIEDVLNET
jgi:hypothetical protein